MLAIPACNPDNIERLADWAELSCLVNESGEISDGDIADSMHNSLLLGEDDSQEEARLTAWDVLRKAEHRSRQLGRGYPFMLHKNNILSRSEDWHECLCYTALLIIDIGNDYAEVRTDYDPSSPLPRLFEKIVQVSLGKVFCGTSVRFGVPREPDWPTGIVQRIERLASEMGLEPDDPQSKVEPNDGDIGLDVATRLLLGDENAGTGVLLTQCATGKNFQAKKGEPPLAEWSSLIHWRSHLIRGVAFPRRFSIDNRRLGRLSKRFEAILFDRHRLLSSGNPDELLDELTVTQLRSWCDERLSEFPG